MVSKFYEPVITILKANATKELGVTEIIHQIGEKFPEIPWGMESNGAVRAMLLRADEVGGYAIKMTPGSRPPTFSYDPSQVTDSPRRGGAIVEYASKSILYAPALECLKAAKGEAVGVSDVLHYIDEKYPDLQWSHGSGPVRAMLLNTAGKPGSGIAQIPGELPPEFFYDAKLASLKPSVPVPNGEDEVQPEASPEEQMETAFAELQSDLKGRLLTALQRMDEYEFERFTNELMSRLGYGQAKTTQKSGDKGIDGLIYGDKLGLRVIRVQSKHFAADNPVSSPLVQAFIGALQGDDGVFVTTSYFTKGAYDAVKTAHTNSKIALIDGGQLVAHMIENNFGVQTTGTVYSLKKLDADFFADYGVEIKS